MKYVFPFVVGLLLQNNTSKAQINNTKYLYSQALDSLKTLLQSNQPQSFKKAVFLTENVYTGNQMQSEKFDVHIKRLAIVIKAWMQTNPLQDYRYPDSLDLLKNFGIFKLMKDTIRFIDRDQKEYRLKPYTYDFTDFTGRKDWGYMFVTKLLATHKGNCHSLPYLYKILADELNATCWLSLAPNHTYIKNRCQKAGWYNTELTSGEFPIDAWITASGYIPLKAAQTGIYMDTLSNQQAIALCVLDLAKGYEHQTRNYHDGFILQCCELALQYHPVNVLALLLKVETLKRVYEKQQAAKQDGHETYQNMELLYTRLFDLGYREMPEKMYLQWLMSVSKQRNKYSNKQLQQSIRGNIR